MSTRILKVSKFDFLVRCKSSKEQLFLQGKLLAARAIYRKRQDAPSSR